VLDLPSTYVGSLMLFQYDGPDGAAWKEWSGNLKNTVILTMGKDGSYRGTSPNATLLNTSLGMLCCEVYYRYANVYACSK
jgi:hypothetical protein